MLRNLLLRKLQDLLGVCNAILRWRIHAFELIWNAKFFPLISTKCMIWQNLHFLDRIQRINEFSCFLLNIHLYL